LGGNGVGKSACVDAVLFVLGHSAKYLKSNEVEQLVSVCANSVKATLHFTHMNTMRSADSREGIAESEQRRVRAAPVASTAVNISK
jgi:chromosome segregation ATPase